MKKSYLFFALMTLVAMACTSEQERMYTELKQTYDEARKGMEYYQSSYDQLQGEYDSLREKYDGQPNKIGKDSLHTQLRQQHDMVLEAHADFFRRRDAKISQHDDLLQRFGVESYGLEDRIKDLEGMIADLEQIKSEYEARNIEQNQLIEEQQGMLRTINTQPGQAPSQARPATN